MITKAKCGRLIRESREKHTGGISISIPQELEGMNFVPVDYLNKVVYPMAQALDEAMDALEFLLIQRPSGAKKYTAIEEMIAEWHGEAKQEDKEQ